MSEQLVERNSAEEFTAVIPDEIIDPGHGNTTAAWTAVIIMTIAIAAGTVFFYLEQPTAGWICAGVLVLGAISGGVLKLMGFGKK